MFYCKEYSSSSFTLIYVTAYSENLPLYQLHVYDIKHILYLLAILITYEKIPDEF